MEIFPPKLSAQCLWLWKSILNCRVIQSPYHCIALHQAISGERLQIHNHICHYLCSSLIWISISRLLEVLSQRCYVFNIICTLKAKYSDSIYSGFLLNVMLIKLIKFTLFNIFLLKKYVGFKIYKILKTFCGNSRI